MPRYRTPHHTDGKGIGRKLKGEALSNRLDELATKANEHHYGAKAAMKGMLDHAREAGEALIEAKRRLGHRRKWSKWRRDNFVGSKETSCHYMRVARDWEDPRIRSARNDGIKIDSINGFLKLLRAEHPQQEREKTADEIHKDDLCEQMRKVFAQKLRALPDEKLDMLTSFETREPTAFDELWNDFVRRSSNAAQTVKPRGRAVGRSLRTRRSRRHRRRSKTAIA